MARRQGRVEAAVDVRGDGGSSEKTMAMLCGASESTEMVRAASWHRGDASCARNWTESDGGTGIALGFELRRKVAMAGASLRLR